VFFLSQGLLINEKKNDLFSFTGIAKVLTIHQENSKYNHYDVPKFHYDDNDNLPNSIQQSFISNQSRISTQHQSNSLIDATNFNEIENTSTSEQNNNTDKSSIATTYDKVSAYSYACLCLFSSSFFIASAYSTTVYIKRTRQKKKKNWLCCFFAIYLLGMHITECFCLLATRQSY